MYDAWGNASILNLDGTAGDFDVNHIANVNPFRWKSHYYDSETNWYYMDGRYYDPAICSYITVDKPKTLLDNIGVRFACRYLITLKNAVALIVMATVWTSDTLAEDTGIYPSANHQGLFQFA